MSMPELPLRFALETVTPKELQALQNLLHISLRMKLEDLAPA